MVNPVRMGGMLLYIQEQRISTRTRTGIYKVRYSDNYIDISILSVHCECTLVYELTDVNYTSMYTSV